MAVGLPLKTTYANGDVYSASDVNDTNGTINANASPYAAGKNKIINGDFNINQRAFTSNTTNGAYNFDRWLQENGGTSGTLTITPQTFTAGAAPVSGYEGSKFIQCVTASGANTDTYAVINQRIEDVRTLASQTATLSFWAKAGSGTPKIAIEIIQNFGTGGSPSAQVRTYASQVTLSTSWARYSVTVAIPSISGKTFGTTANTSYLLTNFWFSGGSSFNSFNGSLGLQNATFQIWGVQLENGSTATPFQTATGTIQGELAACQRYYYRMTPEIATYTPFGQGYCIATYIVSIFVNFPVPMRTRPTSVEVNATATNYAVLNATGGVQPCNTGPTYDSSTSNLIGIVSATTPTSSLAPGNGTQLRANNTASAYIGWSAEL